MSSAFEAIITPTQGQETSHILLNVHKLHQRGLGLRIDLELQF